MKGPLFADEENAKLVVGEVVTKYAIPSASLNTYTILSGIVIFLEIADEISVMIFFFSPEEESTCSVCKSNSALYRVFIDISGFCQPGVCSGLPKF